MLKPQKRRRRRRRRKKEEKRRRREEKKKEKKKKKEEKKNKKKEKRKGGLPYRARRRCSAVGEIKRSQGGNFQKNCYGSYKKSEVRMDAYAGYVMGLNKMVGTVPKYERCIHSEGRMREGWMTPKGTHSEGRMLEGWVVLEVCATTLKDECEKVWTSKGRV
ncbi:hypothetical protein CJ030_MR0G013395 [Morella rubra]|uniref:Uncharacterized protein n=1 Tax=Morella rubra TaxID=262757 RepID=A0A6A1UIE9_9ROSI|nr:hypothetical protein CJ030_MR0G013395 [Morella rubra]